MGCIVNVLNSYNFNKSFLSIKNKSHFILKIFKGFWINYNIKNNNILILEVLDKANKNNIKVAIELIFNIKIISINSLRKKYYKIHKKKKTTFCKKKVYIKYFLI